MIIETYIHNGQKFLIDTDQLEFDKKGKLVNVGETKLQKSVKNDPELLEHYKKWYSLTEINGHFYDRTMIAAVLRGSSVKVSA